MPESRGFAMKLSAARQRVRRPRAAWAVLVWALLGLWEPCGGVAAEKAGKGKVKKEADEDETIAEAQFEVVLEQFEKEKELEAYERMPTVEKFGTAPCKKTVEFLVKLYSAEENPGIRVAISRALAQINTLEAVKAIITVGLPLQAGDNIGLEDVAKSLTRPHAPDVEEWLAKNALTAEVRKDPVVFELFLKALAKMQTKSRISVLLAELKKASPELQVTILESLRPLGDPAVAQTAVSLLKSTNAQVQVAAYDVLAVLPGGRYRSHFTSGLKSSSWEIRALSVDYFSRTGDKDVVKLAAPLLKDSDPRVRVAVVLAFVKHGGPEVIEPLYGAIDSSEGRVKDDIADALARLTGKNFGPFMPQWESWWTQNKGKGLPLKALSDEDFAKLKEQDSNQTTATYFGLRVLSGKLGFLFDTSESMDEEYIPKKKGDEATPASAEEKGKTAVAPSRGKAKGKAKAKKKVTTKLDVAKRELTDVVKGLADGQTLNIFRFNSLITDFVASTLGPEKKALARLTPATRQKINAFIQASKAEGLTNLLGVLKDAMQYPGLDTIYLLSDGAPTIGVTDYKELLSEVERANRRLRIKINVISFDPQPQERQLLQALASQNYGVYVEK
jgi:HEAT repeat protein